MQAADVRFIRGRLKFGGSKDNAPFPNVVVVYKPWGEAMERLQSKFEEVE